MQYKVPQNVDIEDKVVGPLTLRQFLIILVTVGILIVLYFLFPGPLKFFYFLFAVLIGAAGIAIAFAKYGDQNLETFLLSAYKTFSIPRQRIWKKTVEPVQTMAAVEEKPLDTNPKMKKPLSEEKDDLNKLAALVDSGGYVTVAQKDRVIGAISKNELGLEPEDVPDVLDRTEGQLPILGKTLTTAKASAPKREPLVSEVASIKPNKEYKYPKLETKERSNKG